MVLLTNTARVYIDDKQRIFSLYKMGSAAKHATSDDKTLTQALIAAMNGKSREAQGQGVYRVKINGGKGYLVYKTGVNGPESAGIFHYHWNYHLDLPLSAI